MDLLKRKRLRIILLFALGVGLPSVLLGILAFRGIQNDRALVEKSRLEEHRRAVDLVVETLDTHFQEAEQGFLNTIADARETPHPEELKKFLQEYPLVEELFYFQNRENIHFPAADFLFQAEGSLGMPSLPSVPPSLMRIIQRGQQSEFQQNDYQKAILNYNQAFQLASDRQTKGELLNSVARVQKKSSLSLEAMKSYQVLARDYDQVRLSTGLPLGLVAGREIASLYLREKDLVSSVNTNVALFKALIESAWKLEESQYDFFAQNIKSSLEGLFSQVNLPEDVRNIQGSFIRYKEKEIRKREKTERLLNFQEQAVSDLQTRLARNRGSVSSDSKRWTVEKEKHIYLFSLLAENPGDGNPSGGDWGLLFDAAYLRKLLQSELKSRVSGDETGWIVRARGGEVILESDNPPMGSLSVKADFAGSFPDWSLELYQRDTPRFKAFLTSRQGIYFLIFLLIGGILIFGLILTIRTISHELELARMKSDFVSTISHEFKSPLTSIHQLAEMLQAGRIPSEERRQKYYDVLVEQSERLTLLTENVLNFAQMEEGRKEFHFAKVDIQELLDDFIFAYQDRLSHNSFELLLKADRPLPSVTADSAALTQAINNLLDNAVKYSGSQKKAVVSATADDEHLMISVKDFGIGIKREELDKVFDRFYRGGDELTRTVKGSGLGLTLVKHIIEAHGGSVQVESEPGRGSTFSIRIPLKSSKGQTDG
jgi:signal transduction histidine kinase